MRRVVVLVALLLGACDATPPQPVTVYVPGEYEEHARQWLPESGLAVTVIAGDSSTNVERVVTKQDTPRADVLITAGAFGSWRAAEEGALRPLRGESYESVPAAFRDPDGYWAAIGLTTAMIVFGPDAPDDIVGSYPDLGAPVLARRLCLSSSSLPTNRALIAMLIEVHGLKTTERMVRNWVRNLAQPPFASESALQEALVRGDCSVAISSATVSGGAVRVIRPRPSFADVQGIGITRHAEHPEAAQDLVDWVLQEMPALDSPPSGLPNVGVVGYRDEEARLLAERAGYR